MNHIDIVYQAIKTHNTTNPKSPNTLVPAYTGDVAYKVRMANK